jgi:outer membrane lipoprotein-sorting protein
MTCFYESISRRARWYLRIFTVVLLFCAYGLAEQVATPAQSTPLTADEVIARVVKMNQMRSKALAAYSSLRTYHLDCHCIVAKKADMVVRADYRSPDKKNFTIVSEDGNGTIRHKVFRRLLEAEQDAMQDDNQQRSAVSPENYTFSLLEYHKTDRDEFYVLEAKPRSKNRFLIRGRMWVDGRDFAVTRVEGEPAVNPSWWTRKTEFTRTYQKIGEFWLPQSNESVTTVRVFGTAVLTIKYEDYKVMQAPGTTLTLDVWSRYLMGRIESKAVGLLSPEFANVLIGCEAAKGIQPLGEIISGDEVVQVSA